MLKISKQIFAKSVSKVVPVIGGVVSGAITYITFKSMSEAHRQTGANRSAIGKVAAGLPKYKTAGGYGWAYKSGLIT